MCGPNVQKIRNAVNLESQFRGVFGNKHQCSIVSGIILQTDKFHFQNIFALFSDLPGPPPFFTGATTFLCGHVTIKRRQTHKQSGSFVTFCLKSACGTRQNVVRFWRVPFSIQWETPFHCVCQLSDSSRLLRCLWCEEKCAAVAGGVMVSEMCVKYGCVKSAHTQHIFRLRSETCDDRPSRLLEHARIYRTYTHTASTQPDTLALSKRYIYIYI